MTPKYAALADEARARTEAIFIVAICWSVGTLQRKESRMRIDCKRSDTALKGSQRRTLYTEKSQPAAHKLLIATLTKTVDLVSSLGV